MGCDVSRTRRKGNVTAVMMTFESDPRDGIIRTVARDERSFTKRRDCQHASACGHDVTVLTAGASVKDMHIG